MAEVIIKSAQKVVPMIYAYTAPGVKYHEGWIKIGYTERMTPHERVHGQTHTSGLRPQIEWQDNAMYKDGSGQYFSDHDFHSYLQRNCIRREFGTEWFKIDAIESHKMFDKFARRESDDGIDEQDYKLRKEQDDAVCKTKEYFENGGKDFLWNAKPRFGKTLSAYELIQRMNMTNVLIVTNRPSIANSWAGDFFKFIYWRDEYEFVTETDALKYETRAISRSEYLRRIIDNDSHKKMIAFVSLQDLKGSKYFGGDIDKLRWIAKGSSDEPFTFDLLIVDESQEGVDTALTEKAFYNIKREHTLYLSGTPFKALASNKFSSEQIFNWSYSDEQEAKQNWEETEREKDEEEKNPYEDLPSLSMFTYQLSPMIEEHLKEGIDLNGDGEMSEFAFDLNEFFVTNETGRFIHEKEVKAFLHTLSTNEKYPYSTPELRKEMSHTLWLLNRISSAKALAKLLREDPVFSEYTIVNAYGSAASLESSSNEADDATIKKSFDLVKKTISENEKTITLSVGQLTVGVTIPEWSGILMLCNLKSASSYMQAAFRVQNPCLFSRDGCEWRKDTAYVFDFDPARTLIMYDEFANNLSSRTFGGKGTDEERNDNIRRLLNFFPVIGEDEDGKMVELDAEKVLTIPRRIKSTEVVNRGFMCNYLFQNISNVFGSISVQDILKKLHPEAPGSKSKANDGVDKIGTVDVDENGDVSVPQDIVIGKSKDLFGDKIYAQLTNDIGNVEELVSKPVSGGGDGQNNLVDSIFDSLMKNVVNPAFENYNPKKSVRNRIENETKDDVEKAVGKVMDDYKERVKTAQDELDTARKEADNNSQIKTAEENFRKETESALHEFYRKAQEATVDIVNNKPNEIIKKLEKNKKEEEKKSIEDDIRAHLRGFSRTIPSFLMAYGDENITLANFDDYTEDDVFFEVTGITEAEFRFLRDGGDRQNSETGEMGHFIGHLFDEIVFNDSIKLFLEKKDKLANYFDESLDEDIFDYIPPQRTNQIYTPKRVVTQMVDLLEENNPGCFDDDTKTFADLYMKSGLYVTEIVKRLFRSEKMKELHPDPNERIRHILTKQVYGMAPTRIIFLISTNYILGFNKTLKLETTNFVQEDAAAASKEGKLAEVVKEHFGDVI